MMVSKPVKTSHPVLSSAAKPAVRKEGQQNVWERSAESGSISENFRARESLIDDSSGGKKWLRDHMFV